MVFFLSVLSVSYSVQYGRSLVNVCRVIVGWQLWVGECGREDERVWVEMHGLARVWGHGLEQV